MNEEKALSLAEQAFTEKINELASQDKLLNVKSLNRGRIEYKHITCSLDIKTDHTIKIAIGEDDPDGQQPQILTNEQFFPEVKAANVSFLQRQDFVIYLNKWGNDMTYTPEELAEWVYDQLTKAATLDSYILLCRHQPSLKLGNELMCHAANRNSDQTWLLLECSKREASKLKDRGLNIEPAPAGTYVDAEEGTRVVVRAGGAVLNPASDNLEKYERDLVTMKPKFDDNNFPP